MGWISRFFKLLLRRTTPDDASLSDGESTLVDYPAVCKIKCLSDSELSKIFLFSKDQAPDVPVERSISQVEHRWRAIALACPSLWTGIDVDSTEQFQWYCKHSADRLLDVRLWLSQENWESGLLAAVLEELPRLRLLAIRADFSEADAALHDACARLSAPQLAHLSLILLAQPPRTLDLVEIQSRAPLIFNGGVPNLKVLRVQHTELKQPLLPPLRGITTLHLEEYICAPMSFTCFQSMLAELPSLAHLSLYGDVVATWPAPGTLHLPTLRSLRSAATPNWGRMLLALDAPLLDSLVLKDLSSTGLPPNLFGSTETLSLGAIRTLTLDGVFGWRLLASLFCEIGRVRELWLVNCNADEALRLLEGQDLLPENLMVHRVHDTVALDSIHSKGVAIRIHRDMAWFHLQAERWSQLVPWPEQTDCEADDLFMHLK
ncbi:hypothetical protein FB45DRAFT_893669 [Roridomyces roridus]|uniref:F-box domain-containing protein n=1 Tax=Roridomyces roridus TaxID=1738132 RepID=A0AAD7CFZ6_9AGAR|nr:hypothetical protein FB45DRAFT_893669 [Roridomyces roridus]